MNIGKFLLGFCVLLFIAGPVAGGIMMTVEDGNWGGLILIPIGLLAFIAVRRSRKQEKSSTDLKKQKSVEKVTKPQLTLID